MISAASHVDRIACIKIVLDHVEPVIWRRVEVPLTTSLRSLHEVIQAVMLFENYHLFDFTIEAIGDADPGLDYPRFVDGAHRAPPEDVGGIPGFEEFVEAMAKPRHPERKRLIEWYGRVFDPEDIDLPTIKANIAKLARRRAIGKAAFAKSRRSES